MTTRKTSFVFAVLSSVTVTLLLVQTGPTQGNYVPLNSLTISALYKDAKDTTAAAAAATSPTSSETTPATTRSWFTEVEETRRRKKEQRKNRKNKKTHEHRKSSSKRRKRPTMRIPQGQRSRYIAMVLDRFFQVYAEETQGHSSLSAARIKSVLVLALHQLTWTRFSSERMFPPEKQSLDLLLKRVRVEEEQHGNQKRKKTNPMKTAAATKLHRSVPLEEKIFLSALIDVALSAAVATTTTMAPVVKSGGSGSAGMEKAKKSADPPIIIGSWYRLHEIASPISEPAEVCLSATAGK